MANAKFMVKCKRVGELEENEFGLFKKLSKMEVSLEDSGKKVEELGLNIQALNQEIGNLKTQHTGELAAKAVEISGLQNDIAELKSVICEHPATIDQGKEKLAAANCEISAYQKIIQQKENTIGDLSLAVNRTIDDLKQEIETKDNLISVLEAETSKLHAHSEDYDRIKSSNEILTSDWVDTKQTLEITAKSLADGQSQISVKDHEIGILRGTLRQLEEDNTQLSIDHKAMETLLGSKILSRGSVDAESIQTSGKKSEKELRSHKSEKEIRSHKSEGDKRDKDNEKIFEDGLNKLLTKLEENRAKSVDRDTTLKKLGKDLGVVEEEIDDDENDIVERRSTDHNPSGNGIGNIDH